MLTKKLKSLKAYYEIGIELLNTERIEQEFISLVKSKISEYRNQDQDIKKAINRTKDFNEEIRQKTSGNNVCLHFDKRHALTQPGFCFYGGEYMCYIIRHYPNKQIEQHLIDICKTIGIPTLFTVRFPLDNEIMNTSSFMSYIKTLLVYWASRYIYKQHLSGNVNYVCTTTFILFIFHDMIAPKYIHRHEHPRKFCNNIDEFYCDRCKKKIIRKSKEI